MSNKSTNFEIKANKDFFSRVNLFVQTHTALMALVIAAILFIATIIINPKGLSIVAVGNIILMTILLSLPAAGQTLVLIGGGMDFGIGAVMSATAILTSFGMKGENGHFLPVFLIAIAIGAGVGFLNGYCSIKIGLPAMIVTMALANIVTRCQFIFSNGIMTGAPSPAFRATVSTKVLGFMPAIAMYAIIIWPLVFFLLNKSRFGKQLYLVGNNPTAAKLTGVKVDKIRILSYVFSGVLAAFAGMLGAAYLNIARCQLFDDYAYQSLIATIIGGTTFAGGAGSYAGSIAGSLVMVLLSNLLTALGLPDPLRNVCNGVILVLLLLLYNRGKSVRQ